MILNQVIYVFLEIVAIQLINCPPFVRVLSANHLLHLIIFEELSLGPVRVRLLLNVMLVHDPHVRIVHLEKFVWHACVQVLLLVQLLVIGPYEQISLLAV